MPLRIGETFAGYRVLRLLGSGGMGDVYVVQHPRLPHHDAVKVLRQMSPVTPSLPPARSFFGGAGYLVYGLQYGNDVKTNGTSISRAYLQYGHLQRHRR